MTLQVCSGAALLCPFAIPVPSVLVPTPGAGVTIGGLPAATIMDITPANVPVLGMCISPSNPAFVAATSAALGVPTPVPCTPLIQGPWAPGSPTVMIAKMPALTQTDTCTCALGGVISITSPGQMSVIADG